MKISVMRRSAIRIIPRGLTGLMVLAAVATSAGPEAAGLSETLERAGIRSVEPPVPAVEFRLPAVAGDEAEVTLSDARGRWVVLTFFASWCGPCMALTPVLEKVAADYADNGVVLKKVNVDEEKFIAAQFQVKSIPTVYAMFQGQPVAELTQARTESQLSQMLDHRQSADPFQTFNVQ